MGFGAAGIPAEWSLKKGAFFSENKSHHITQGRALRPKHLDDGVESQGATLESKRMCPGQALVATQVTVWAPWGGGPAAMTEAAGLGAQVA